MSHHAPTESARLIYGSTTTRDGSTTIHPDGATNAHEASMIRYCDSTIQPVAPRPAPRTVFMMNRCESGWIGMNRVASDT